MKKSITTNIISMIFLGIVCSGCMETPQRSDARSRNPKNISSTTQNSTPPVSTNHNDESNPTQAADGSPITQEVMKQEQTQAEQNLQNLKKELGEIELSLERERDRESKLSKELLGSLAIGCMARQNVQQLEILINGAHLEKGKSFETGQTLQTEGSPGMFRFIFGDQFVYTHADEEQQPLFRQAGRVLLMDFAHKKIGDIEQIRIVKGGRGIESTKHCWTEWVFFTKCRWKNTETHRYWLDSVEIRVNGLTFYKRDGINFTFENDKREWVDTNIFVNQHYLTLMGRTDCPAQ